MLDYEKTIVHFSVMKLVQATVARAFTFCFKRQGGRYVW